MIKYTLNILLLLSVSLNIFLLNGYTNNPFVTSKTTSELLQQSEISDREFYNYMNKLGVDIDKSISIPLTAKQNLLREVSTMPYIVIESKKPFYGEAEINAFK